MSFGLCSDESKVAAWTRVWRCQWKVLIDGKSYGPFSSRSDAIAFEEERSTNKEILCRAPSRGGSMMTRAAMAALLSVSVIGLVSDLAAQELVASPVAIESPRMWRKTQPSTTASGC
jgi:hypothetical protein